MGGLRSVALRVGVRIWLATVLAVFAVGAGPVTATAVTASPSVPAAGSGACGSTLLAGSKWLGGLGVTVKSNGSDQGTGTSCGGTSYVHGVKAGSEWQCTELVNRLYLTRGWISATWYGNGGDSTPTSNDSMYDEAPTSLSKQANGSISSVGPGDVVSVNEYDNGVFVPDGHVLIVNSTGPITSGTVPMVSQNFGSSSDAIVDTTATLTGGTLTIAGSGGWSYSIIGVVHAPAWQADTVAMPANAGPVASLPALACASAASCVAAGYSLPGEQYQPLLVTGSSPSWQATVAPLPANVSGGELYSVACPSATSCTAVGYGGYSGGDQGLLETGSGTSWTATEAPLPANAATPSDDSLSAVACHSTTACVAVGDYYTTSNNSGDGLLETGAGTSWTPVEAPVPANSGPDWGISLNAVSCPSATSCVAVGSYSDPQSGYSAGLLVTGSGSSWTATEAPVPANAAANPAVTLLAVACHSATSCVATGSYEVSAGDQQGLLLTGSGTHWKAAEAPLPADAATDPGADFASVACPSSTACTAVSFYDDSSGNFEGVLVSGHGTAWTATEAPVPANAASTPYGQLLGVACQSVTSCLAVGDYKDSTGSYQGLLVTGSGTSWTATEAPLPADADPTPNASLFRAACPSTTWCITVGSYDGSSGAEGFLVTGLPS